MKNRIMFLRDNKGQPVGCLAINVDLKNHRLTYQMSVLNPDDRFNRKVARHLALGRLMEIPISLPLKRDRQPTMHDVSRVVMTHLALAKAPSRARKAATLWISNNTNIG